ncbi:hypothetical protein PR048_026440 [Dryococelus australis]|uniref:Uncharacterized protein n=1 Tax=Dryococelus australis TaxID=614101 RepID=A0ABQ9GLB3_9NEOP|nr:hypothetical protein PR048_026440 [Dryococelus australis]
MPRKYMRKKGRFPVGVSMEENLAEAFLRVKAGDIGINEAAQYFPSHQALLEGDFHQWTLKSMDWDQQAF